MKKFTNFLVGDTLNERGFLWASQFCYLMANKEFGHYENSSSKIVLLGADKSLPFAEFASNEAIQLTEIFEYVQKLSNPDHVQHSFLHYKYLYAVRLLDFGLTGQALHYLEELALAVTKDPNSVDQEFKPYLSQIYNLADKLKFLDPMYTTREGEITEMGDPDWLTQFQKTVENMQYDHNSSESNNTAPAAVMESQWFQDDQGRFYYYDAATGSYQYPAEEQVEQEQPKEPDTPIHQESTTVDTPTEATEDPPIMMTPQPASRRESESTPAPPLMMPPSSAPSIPSMPTPPTMQENTPPPMMPVPTISAPTPSLPAPPVSQPGANYFADMKTEAAKPAPVKPPTKAPSSPKKKAEPKSSAPPKSGFFSSILGKIGVLPPNQAHLPDESENTIVWDEEKKRWVDKNATEDEDNNASTAPPSDMELSRNNSTANFDSAPPTAGAMPPPGGAAPPPPMMGQNKFAGGLSKKRGAGGRIDVFKNSQSSPALSNNLPPPSELFAPMAPITPAMTPQEANEASVAPSATGAPSAPSTPIDGPVFFNPNAIAAAPAPSTRRNKYA